MVGSILPLYIGDRDLGILDPHTKVTTADKNRISRMVHVKPSVSSQTGHLSRFFILGI